MCLLACSPERPAEIDNFDSIGVRQQFSQGPISFDSNYQASSGLVSKTNFEFLREGISVTIFKQSPTPVFHRFSFQQLNGDNQPYDGDGNYIETVEIGQDFRDDSLDGVQRNGDGSFSGVGSMDFSYFDTFLTANNHGVYTLELYEIVDGQERTVYKDSARINVRPAEEYFSPVSVLFPVGTGNYEVNVGSDSEDLTVIVAGYIDPRNSALAFRGDPRWFFIKDSVGAPQEITFGLGGISRDGRYQSLRSEDGKTFTLKILNADVDHAGVYYLTVENNIPTADFLSRVRSGEVRAGTSYQLALPRPENLEAHQATSPGRQIRIQ